MNVALILVSLGIATGPEPLWHPLMVASFEDMKSCVEAANHAELPGCRIGGALPQHLGAVCVRANEKTVIAGPRHTAIEGPSTQGGDRVDLNR